MSPQRLDAQFVDYIPEKLQPGIIYISKRYRTASHLCACGCGLEVTTPFNPAKWKLIESPKGVSLKPSIGNWSFPCKSHYFINNGNIQWAGQMSAAAQWAVKNRDRRDADRLAAARQSPQHQPVDRRPGFGDLIDAAASALAKAFRKFLGR